MECWREAILSPRSGADECGIRIIVEPYTLPYMEFIVHLGLGRMCLAHLSLDVDWKKLFFEKE
jgi:hypothetical protein